MARPAALTTVGSSSSGMSLAGDVGEEGATSQDERSMASSTRRAADISGASVELRNLEKRYGALTAVQDLSMAVEPGEFLAILGPSGCGKSTILKCVAGFEGPDAGTIGVAGKRIDRLPANRRNIGMVFQNYALFPHMTVAENVAFPLRMRGFNKAAQGKLAGEALATVGLEGLGTRLPSQLSGGQQQRVALARSIVYRPPVLLLDEPLSALDKKLRERMQIELKQLQRDLGVTVLFVTHDQHEAITMADRIAVMNAGRLEQVDTARALYERPRTEFVADFIGDSNRFLGTVERVSEAGALEVRIDGHPLQCVASGDWSPRPAHNVSIRVRPEHIEIGEKGSAGLEAEIKDLVYEGYTTVVMLETAVGHLVRSRVPAADCQPLEFGRPVSISWKPKAALAFEA